MRQPPGTASGAVALAAGLGYSLWAAVIQFSLQNRRCNGRFVLIPDVVKFISGYTINDFITMALVYLQFTDIHGTWVVTFGLCLQFQLMKDELTILNLLI